jgi:hypothetical protein
MPVGDRRDDLAGDMGMTCIASACCCSATARVVVYDTVRIEGNDGSAGASGTCSLVAHLKLLKAE